MFLFHPKFYAFGETGFSFLCDWIPPAGTNFRQARLVADVAFARTGTIKDAISESTFLAGLRRASRIRQYTHRAQRTMVEWANFFLGCCARGCCGRLYNIYSTGSMYLAILTLPPSQQNNRRTALSWTQPAVTQLTFPPMS